MSIQKKLMLLKKIKHFTIIFLIHKKLIENVILIKMLQIKLIKILKRIILQVYF